MIRLLIACATLLAAGEGLAQPIVSSAVLASPPARYVFGQVGEFARNQYMLDTVSGRLWQIVCAERDQADASKCTQFVLQPVRYIDGDGANDSPPSSRQYARPAAPAK